MKLTIDKWSLLAFVRFALAFMVAVSHLESYAIAHLDLLSWVPALGPIERVMGFLLISGYSIGTSYGREASGFLQRRIWRIYPMYVAAIALTCVAIPQALDGAHAATLLQNLLFLNQLTTVTSFIEPAWSLALEVWFYCLTPWLWRLSAEHLRALMYGSFFACCCYELGRTAFHFPYYAGAGYGINLPVLAFPWIAGFLMAREPALASRTLRDIALIFGSHILLALAVQTLYRWKHQDLMELFAVDLAEFAARSLTLVMLLFAFKWIVEGRTGAVRNKTMRFLGDLAYPLYLVHLAVFIILTRFEIRDAALHLGTAVLTAFLLYRLLDPISRSRARSVTRKEPEPAALQKQEVGELPASRAHLEAQ